MLKRKTLASIISLALPLTMVVGFSTWVIVNNVVIKPIYEKKDLDLADYFDLDQSTIYNGQEQVPTHKATYDFEESELYYEYKLHNEAVYSQTKPLNAGVYDVRVRRDDSSIHIVYTIEKATPTVTVRPTLSSIYEGEQSIIGDEGIAVGINDQVLNGDFGFKYAAGTANLEYNGTAETCINVAQLRFTPIGEDALNYAPVDFAQNIEMKPVCTIGTDYYGSIEKALSVATSGQTVNVIPSLPIDVHIRKNATIPNDVTLALPYEGTTTEDRNGSINSFADATQELVTQNRKTNVIIDKGVTLINNGILRIGGIVGNLEYALQGQTCSSYTQITMDASSKIVSNGDIYCLGYIKELALDNGSSVEITGGSVYQPFVIHDYRGGVNALSVYRKSSIAPFNVIDLPNIQPQYIINSTGSVKGYYDLYSGNRHTTGTINVIGNSSSGSMFALTNDGRMEIKYHPTTLGLTTSSSDTTTINIYGGATTNAPTMNLYVNTGNQTMTLSQVYMPHSWKFDTTIHSGSYTLNNKVKFMTGSTFTIDSSATLNATQSFVVYDAFTDTSFKDVVYPTKSAAVFMNNGKLTIAAQTGGIIQTSDERATLSVTTNSFTVTATEGNSGSTTAANATQNNTNRITVTTSLNKAIRLQGYVTANGNRSLANLSRQSYYSNGNSWVAANNMSTYTITFHANHDGAELTGPETSSYPIGTTEVKTITSISTSIPVLENYTFDGWYLNSACTTPLIGSSVRANDSIQVYAKWTPIVYNVTYNYTFVDCEVRDDVTNIGPESFNAETGFYLKTPISGELYFYGWYLDSSYSKEFLIGGNTDVDISLLKDYIEGNNLTLYGFFSPTIFYDVNYVTNDADITIFSDLVATGDHVSLPEDIRGNDLIITKDRYFLSWYTTPDYKAGSEFDGTSPILSETTLYAKWADKYVVTLGDYPAEYYSPGQSLLAKEVTKDSDTRQNSTGTIHVDYEFNYWKANDVVLLDGDTVVVNSNLEFTPYFKETYSAIVTLNISGKNDDETLTVDGVAYGNTTTDKITVYLDSENGTTNLTVIGVAGNNRGSDIEGTRAEGTNNAQVAVKADMTVTVQFGANGPNICIAEGSLITLADGSSKKVEELTANDLVLTFNHATNQFEAYPMALLVHQDESAALYRIITLNFENNVSVSIIKEHGFFNKTVNEYVFINEENIDSFIGDSFVYVENEEISLIKLLSYDIEERVIRVFSPVTYKNMNCFVNGLLSYPDGMVNLFEYCEDSLQYDLDKLQNDILTYGLFTYEDFSYLLTEEQFNMFPFEYLSVAYAKGIISQERIEELFELYVNMTYVLK